MPTYEFECADSEASIVWTSKSQHPAECPHGSKQFRRLWAFQGVVKGWGGGFAPAIGDYVPNAHQFEEKLKAASHHASEELGMEHRFRPIDPRDHQALKVTDE